MSYRHASKQSIALQLSSRMQKCIAATCYLSDRAWMERDSNSNRICDWCLTQLILKSIVSRPTTLKADEGWHCMTKLCDTYFYSCVGLFFCHVMFVSCSEMATSSKISWILSASLIFQQSAMPAQNVCLRFQPPLQNFEGRTPNDRSYWNWLLSFQLNNLLWIYWNWNLTFSSKLYETTKMCPKFSILSAAEF